MAVITVPCPRFEYFPIVRRMSKDNKRQTNDLMAYLYSVFIPPASTDLWPQYVGDIGCEFMNKVRFYARTFRVNQSVLVDGVAYFDDSVFWLSKITSQSENVFIYGTVISASN